MDTLEVWRTVTLSFAAVGQTAFVLMYMTLPWWRSTLGRALFLKAFMLMSLIDAGIASRVWDWRGEDAVIVGLYGLVSVGIWFQLFAFIHQGRKDHSK